ncbi:hypothetical protein APY03_6200 [Variovorax sp. WDL1]|nr:hypothetical protein APY03_6200 [Variovorax sp. WDL1]
MFLIHPGISRASVVIQSRVSSNETLLRGKSRATFVQKFS